MIIKKIAFCLIICKWKLNFKILNKEETDRSNEIITFHVTQDKMHNKRKYSLRQYLLSKIEYFERSEYNISHISEMTITFMARHDNMTYKYYL